MMNTQKQKSEITKRVLKSRFGFFWFLILIQSVLVSRKLFTTTKWGRTANPESDFLRPYALVSALYLNLRKKVGEEEALIIMKKIIVEVGCLQQQAMLHTIHISENAPMERLMAFHKIMDEKGATKFNDRVYVKTNENVCHFIIKRCVFKDYFDAVGMPELTKFFCEVDKEFFPPAFPHFLVHRGSSWDNTLAYGKPQCDFIFEKNDAKS